MLTQEQSVEIKVMARQGHSIKAIARELGLSRNTIRKYLRGKATFTLYQAPHGRHHPPGHRQNAS